MRRLLPLALLAFVLAPAAIAQVGDTGGDPGCGLTYPCDSDFPPPDDQGGMVIIRCRDTAGCPQCSSNWQTQEVICERKPENTSGVCKCQPIGWVRDQYGVRPKCSTEGACSIH